jgi:hypothetical protein
MQQVTKLIGSRRHVTVDAQNRPNLGYLRVCRSLLVALLLLVVERLLHSEKNKMASLSETENVKFMKLYCSNERLWRTVPVTYKNKWASESF